MLIARVLQQVAVRFTATMGLRLTPDELAPLLRQTTLAHAIARCTRIQVILRLADGQSYATIGAALGVTDRFIAVWKRRYVEGGVLALAHAPRGGRGHGLAPATEAKILHLTLHERPPDPLDNAPAGPGRRVSHNTVAQVWRRAGLQPHRVERYAASPDPAFERKAADIIGLYVTPPKHAVVFAVDEKTAIQALDRTQPVLGLSPGRAERHGFEYIRHGTPSLYAVPNVHTGPVIGETAPRYTSAAFAAFLDCVVASQVELWFAKIERDCMARGIFTSTADLRRKLLQYIKLHNATCQPFVWRYRDPKRRIRATRMSVTTQLDSAEGSGPDVLDTRGYRRYSVMP